MSDKEDERDDRVLLQNFLDEHWKEGKFALAQRLGCSVSALSQWLASGNMPDNKRQIIYELYADFESADCDELYRGY